MSAAAGPTPFDDALGQWMNRLGVREEDLEETFVRSGGHGGQNVNKTSTCVLLVHRPTGLRVKCQTARTQGANRAEARRLLLSKLEERRRLELDARRHQAEKNRRRNRPRSRAAKERILASKKRQSEKKARRARQFDA